MMNALKNGHWPDAELARLVDVTNPGLDGPAREHVRRRANALGVAHRENCEAAMDNMSLTLHLEGFQWLALASSAVTCGPGMLAVGDSDALSNVAPDGLLGVGRACEVMYGGY